MGSNSDTRKEAEQKKEGKDSLEFKPRVDFDGEPLTYERWSKDVDDLWGEPSLSTLWWLLGILAVGIALWLSAPQ